MRTQSSFCLAVLPAEFGPLASLWLALRAGDTLARNVDPFLLRLLAEDAANGLIEAPVGRAGPLLPLGIDVDLALPGQFGDLLLELLALDEQTTDVLLALLGRHLPQLVREVRHGDLLHIELAVLLELFHKVAAREAVQPAGLAL